MVIPWYGLVFFVSYLCIIWFINALMVQSLRGMAGAKQYAAWLVLSNICLAAGDTVLFLSLLISFMQKAAPCEFSFFYLTLFSSMPGTQFLTVPGGIFATSVTMSLYYLFLALYVRDGFATGMTGPTMAGVYILCAARILLLFLPDNIWLSSCLPANTPNYSAWLRNAPFFVYGILAILALARATRRTGSHGENTTAGYGKNMTAVTAALLCSFTFYGIDIFFSHKIGTMGIWMAMIAKTITYIVAAFAMWQAEFKREKEPGETVLSDL